MDRRRLSDRFKYDRARRILLIDFAGLYVRDMETVREIERIVGECCGKLGRRVDAVVNYVDFRIDESVVDAYAATVRRLVDGYYDRVTRYSPNAFLRARLGAAGVLNDSARPAASSEVVVPAVELAMAQPAE